MITALRKRTRPDNLVNQVRAGGKSTARRVYLITVSTVVALLVLQFLGPVFFLDADGLSSKERLVLAPDYAARIEMIHVKPGDLVAERQPIATLHSSDVTDRLTDLIGKRAALLAREAQITSRLASLATLAPLAVERAKRSRASVEHLGNLLKRQLTTSARLSEAIREFYEAEREEAQTHADARTMAQEKEQIVASLVELDRVIASLKASYNDGVLVALAAGRIGSRVPSRGQVMKRGDPIVDIYHGDTHVIAYVPSSRLYGVEIGDRVLVTDGINRRIGEIERVEAVTDALPAEFQSNFKSVERQQVMRIAFEGEAPFPILAKVKVMSRFSPYALASMARTAISVAEGPLDAARLMVAELSGRDRWPVFDTTAIGSLGSGAVPVGDEEQPFPESSAPLPPAATRPETGFSH